VVKPRFSFEQALAWLLDQGIHPYHSYVTAPVHEKVLDEAVKFLLP
jgi:hypothetical protein